MNKNAGLDLGVLITGHNEQLGMRSLSKSYSISLFTSELL